VSEGGVGEDRAGIVNRVEAVERALRLLQSFHTPGESLTLAQLAQRTALSKSTILRLAGSLVHNGFLHRDATRAFMLGPQMERLGRLARPAFDLQDLIRPVLRELAEGVGETSSFYVRDGDMRLCLYRCNSARAARHHLDEGSRHPLDRGAAGLVLRAFAGADGAEAEAARRRGWVISIGGRNAELAAVAAPLLTPGGELLGALTVSGLAGRFDEEKLEQSRRALLAAAAALKPRLPSCAAQG
jgi:DNA-binding IclR family transcriptional regulator